MNTIKDLWKIAKKDLLEFRRDRLRLVTFLVMPIFMMVMTGFIFPNQNSLKNIPIGIVNLDGQETSKKLVEVIVDLSMTQDQSAFQVKKYNSLEEIKSGIKKQEVNGGLFISNDFSEKLLQNEQVEVTVIENQSNPQISSMVSQVLTKVVEGFSQQLGYQKVSQILLTTTPVPQDNRSSDDLVSSLMQPIRTKLEGIVPGDPNYFEFIAPGIMAMIVMTAVLTGLAASISREKEQGTLEGILISPINRLSIILGKALSQSIRGFIQGFIVLLLAFLLFGVTVQGNLLLVGLLLLLGIFSFVGLGILVSAVATEQETASQLLMMFQFPMLFLSGVFFPILMMPDFMQKIARLIPLTYAINALRKVMVLGAGFAEVQNEILLLFLFGTITLTISVPLFKRIITK